MKFRIRQADRIVGLFIVLSAVLLAAGIVVVGANQRWFSKDYHFHARFASASNITVGMPLTLRGFQIGKINKISLGEDNQVDVELVVFDTYYPKVTENSLIELSVSPIGLGTALLFHPGRSTDPLPPGSTLPRADSEEGQRIIDENLADIPPRDDTITKLLGSVGPLVDNLGRTVTNLNRTITEINKAITGQGGTNELSGIISGVNGAIADVDRLVLEVGKGANDVLDTANEIADSVVKTTASLEKTATNVEALTSQMTDPYGLVPKLLGAEGSIKTLLDDKNALYDSIMSVVSDAEASLASIQSMTASLEGQVPNIISLLDETQATIIQAQDVLEGVSNNPLIRGGIPKRVEQGQLYQGMREGDFQ